MKINKFLSLIMIVVIGGIMNSCDDVLEKEPLGALSELTVFNDAVLLENFVNAAYGRTLRNGFSAERLTSDAMSDNGYMLHDRGTWAFTRGQMTADNGESYTQGVWSRSYAGLRRTNLFFEQTVESSVDSETLDRLSGEMRFLRAYAHYELLRHYGGVPIADRVFLSDDDFASVPRASYDDVVDFIVTDLDQAAALLQGSGSVGGRPTSHAAMALKARVLLYAASPLNNPSNDTSKWQAAANAAKAVIDLGTYSLDSDFANIFLNEGSSEHIWTRTFNQNDGHSTDLNNNPNGYNGWGGTVPLQDLVDAFEMSNGEAPLLEDGSVNPVSGYDLTDPYTDRDPRFYATILYHGADWKGRPVDVSLPDGIDSPGSSNGPWNSSLSGYSTRKFLQEDAPVNNSQRSTTPWVFFRLTEMYLNYAEAQIELGNDGEAQTYINMVRTRAGMPPVTETGDALRKRYQNERRIEMAFEDQRIFDVNRWMTASEELGGDALGVLVEPDGSGGFTYDFTRVVDGTRAWDPAYLRFPIPRAEVEILQIDQNPGYN